MLDTVRPTKTMKKKSSPLSLALPPAPPAFMQALYANILNEDLKLFSTETRAQIAASLWLLAQERKKGHHKLRLFNPSLAQDGWTVGHTVLEIVNDDMPFLVDSVTSAFQRRGLTVHLVLHPVIWVIRTPKGQLQQLETNRKKESANVHPESILHLQFDHCLDPDMLADIEKEMNGIMNDVRAAVEDWRPMRALMAKSIEAATASKHLAGAAAEHAEESRAFLRWLDDNNFTYLGYRDIDLVQKDGQLISVKVKPESGLGVLRDKELRMFGGLRDINANKSSFLQKYVRQHHLIVVTKTNAHARVHRSVPMDAIFVRRFNDKGDVIGEQLFVGLFTSQSYSQNPREIPFLRHKIDHVLQDANLESASHDGKALVHILNNYPRDELFQISEDELLENGLGILQLQERARVALFLRVDPFDRFITALIYIPRDRYDSALRQRIQNLLESTFDGQAEDWNVRLDDSVLARVFTVIKHKPTAMKPDASKLETIIRDMCRSWTDQLRDGLASKHGEATALGYLRQYGDAFPPSYRDAVLPDQAVADIQSLERCRAMPRPSYVVDLTMTPSTKRLHVRLFETERPVVLSDALPLIENMGLKIEYMGGPYDVTPKGAQAPVFIHEFVGCPAHPLMTDFAAIEVIFEEAFGKVWSGEVENDSFNALTLRAGLPWRHVVVMRLFARYLRQLRIPYSHEMIAATFLHHPHVAQHIVQLFITRHDPDLKGDRAAKCQEIEDRIHDALKSISILEEDRIIRRYLNLVQASLRTNYFQTTKDGACKPYLSVKFDSRAVEFMPLPKPLYEIFVYSPRVEAVHLRGGKVARGGIRWSDRRDDFRNEILGLMKAQMVKNTVIVPEGSKGGFIVKCPPTEPEKYHAEGVACYRTMMCGLLDLTDNRVGTKITPPPHVVRHDEDDPYLVVAADKGTAKFSDIANGISQEYGFWLDDAFASGGSAGYDHKQMGITARGAWESVKRHFRETGKDIQTTDFTCIGVGDMSGDVFGNGMLLSKHIRLLAAFDHRHIFLDPSPDSAISFAERKRLFDLPRSSWADYNAEKISKGGGVHPRTAKTIRLTADVKRAFGITADSLPPNELIQVLLKADVELLYFGGIGTYVKSSDETQEEVGDRSAEATRVDGHEIRAKIITEGANLGVTQRGRIEYALKGGRINTDAIDNSAGVDTSDHEVNIKILLRKIVDRGSLSLSARNNLLKSMTDDVAALVLRDNYLQTLALSVAEAYAPEQLPQHVTAMHILEKSGLLNRDIENLPHSTDITERLRAGKGLTRPELAVLLSYAKIAVYKQLLASSLPDDPALHHELESYFPEALRKKYAPDIAKHQLRREIIATAVTNSTINRAGSQFVLTMCDRTGEDVATVTRAYLLARETFGLLEIWKEIENLDNRIPAAIQTQMLRTIKMSVSKAVYWFLTEMPMPEKLAPAIATYGAGVEGLSEWLTKKDGRMDANATSLMRDWVEQGAPHALAQRVAQMPMLTTALDLTRLAAQSRCSLSDLAETYFELGHRLGIDWIVTRARALAVHTPWQREAVIAVLDELATTQRNLTTRIIGRTVKSKTTKSTDQKRTEWLQRHATVIERHDARMNEWRSAGSVDIAMLFLASRQLAGLAE